MRIQRGGGGEKGVWTPPPPPPGKSHIIWVSIGTGATRADPSVNKVVVVLTPLVKMMGYETPYPEPLTVSRNTMGTKINYCLFKRCDILVSKYPESFVQIEKVVRKKINFYYSEGVSNTLPQMNMKTSVDMKCSGN